MAADEARPAMTPRRCLNCDSTLDASARFCPVCGQRCDTGRLSLADVRRDLMHSFVNIERGPLAFALALLLRPGAVARDYVQGRRRRHYGPFATLVVIVGLTTLAVNGAGLNLLVNDGMPAGPADLLQRHFNLLLLAQVPLLGGVCRLVFPRAGLNLPEHMVLGAYAMSVRAVVLVLVVPAAYLSSTFTPGLAQNAVYWGAWYVYFGWAASQFYEGPRLGNWLRGSLAAAIGHAAIMLVLFVGIVAYEILFVPPALRPRLQLGLATPSFSTARFSAAKAARIARP